MNQDLQKLHEMLIAQVVALSQKIGETTDPDMVRTMVQEIQELNHRVNLVGALLFTEQTKKITDKVAAVVRANSELEDSIEHLETVTKFVKDVTAFLQVVDQAIDLAKLV